VKHIRVILISGVSGSGKTTAIKALEDIGFYCVDNLPILLLLNHRSLCPIGGKIPKSPWSKISEATRPILDRAKPTRTGTGRISSKIRGGLSRSSRRRPILLKSFFWSPRTRS